MTTTSNAAGWYSNVFKAWPAKQLGAKPTGDMLATAHVFGRPGKQSLALALAMRDSGVTASQIIMACGAPQNNHRRGLIGQGLFKREPVPASDQGHTVYKVVLTAKGHAAVKRASDAAAKAAVDGGTPKASKAKAKRRKAPKAAPAQPATPQPEVTTAPAPVTTGDAPATA